MVLAKLCPVGVLFVRCAEGISHNPLESISLRDADIGAHVLLDFIRNFR
jgi:acetylornithine deacetylase/succinyl-diaminopimelate desuccinylase-like protein